MSTRNPWSAIVYDHLLGTRLLSEPIRNAHEEQQLTALRRRCLEGGRSTPTLLAHLAIQCFLNEYAWWEGEDETSELTHLPMDSKGLLLRACYRGLADLPGAAELLRTDWPAPLRAVLKTQIADVLSEGQFSASVPALTPIRGGVSEVVREMYEANPYPRWALIGSPKSEPAGAVADILVAGCGTGKHSIHTALRYPGARVLAVDLSRASLGYAMRLTAQAGIANIEYAQADLLELPSLGRTFDLVESFGTLPCMEDPAEGLAALTRLMRPGGKIRLGLYSEAARRPLVPAQALGRAYPGTPDGIRAFRRAIQTAQPNDSVRAALEFPDFYSTSTCRDLLMHVVEHVHDIPQIAAMLRRAGLEFLGFDPRYGALDRYLADFPDDPAGLDLQNWADFEARNPTTFRKMYHFTARLAK